MTFSARITVTGLSLLVTDDDTNPKNAELLLVDSEAADHSVPARDSKHHAEHQPASDHHQHFPLLTIPYSSRGLLQRQKPGVRVAELEGWPTYSIGTSGNAMTHLSLAGKLVKLIAKRKNQLSAFEMDSSMARLPDLRLLGMEGVDKPVWTGQMLGASARVSLPLGTLSTRGVTSDEMGSPVKFKKVGVIAKALVLDLVDIEELRVDYGLNEFTLRPLDGLLELGISNEPRRYSGVTRDQAGRGFVVPHFGMYGQLASNEVDLKLLREGKATPGTPACPCGKITAKKWAYLAHSV